MEFIAPLLFGFIVGVSLGLTGGGGSILAVPMLVYGLGLKPTQAALVSLCAVGATAATGAVRKLLSREIETRAGMIVGISGIVAAPIGVWLGRYLSDRATLLLFALLMLTVALSMWRNASRSPEEIKAKQEAAFGSSSTKQSRSGCSLSPGGSMALTKRCGLTVAAAGVLTGILSGLFGVGGGFIVVPALILIARLDIRRAVATSLLVVVMVSAAGTSAAFFSGGNIPVGLTALFAMGGTAGMEVGVAATSRLPGSLVQKVFSLIICTIAVFVIVQNVR